MMKPVDVRFVMILVCSFIVQAGCIGDDDKDHEETGVAIGNRLPSLNLTLSDGTIISDDYLSDKTSLILLFTTACPDCRDQLPVVEQLYREMKDDKGFVLFGISREQSEDVVSDYWSNNDITMPYSAQKDRQVYELFALSGVPRIYIADKDRVVVFMSDDDPKASYDDLKNAIESLN